MTRPSSITPHALFARLFDADAPVLIDIRIPEDLEAHPGRVPAAFRISHDDREAIGAAVTPGQGVVALCHGGLKLSQGLASWLASRGAAASYLEGGTEAWRAAGLPLWDPQIAPATWVTHWDRTAERGVARWLASRLLPRPTEILAVAPDQVAGAADRFGAVPLPGAGDILALLDGPVPALATVLEAAETPVMSRLSEGLARKAIRPGDWSRAMADVFDALAIRELGDGA